MGGAAQAERERDDWVGWEVAVGTTGGLLYALEWRPQHVFDRALRMTSEAR